MPRGKQVVKKGMWYIGGGKRKKRKQQGKGIPFGLVASVAAPILSEIAKPVFQKMFGRKSLTTPKFKKRKGLNYYGKGIGSNLIKTGINLVSKAIGSEFGKKIIKKGIDNIPNAFKFGILKIKNKDVKKILSSDIADMVVDETQNRVKNKYKTLFD